MPRRQIETEIDIVGSDASLYSRDIIIKCEWLGDLHKGFPAVSLAAKDCIFSRKSFTSRCSAAAFVFPQDCTRTELWDRIARLFDHSVAPDLLQKNAIRSHPLKKNPIRSLTFFTSADSFSYLLLNVSFPMDFSKMASIGRLIQAVVFLPKTDFDNTTRLYQYLSALVVEPTLGTLNTNELELLVSCLLPPPPPPLRLLQPAPAPPRPLRLPCLRLLQLCACSSPHLRLLQPASPHVEPRAPAEMG
jgi:hypothetical protein